MTDKKIINEIGKKGLKTLPKSKLPRTIEEQAALIVSTHIKNRKEGGPILLTKVEYEGGIFYYGVMSSVNSTWWKVDREGENCICKDLHPCMHELAILYAKQQKIQIPTFEDILNDDKTDDEHRRSVHNFD